MLVKEVMHPAPVCLAPDTPVADAVQMMVSQQQSCLLVVDDAQLLGIVTERDLTHLLDGVLRNPKGHLPCLRELMTAQPVCVDESDPCADALALSRTRSLRHLPVLDAEDKVVGVVTQGNLLEAYAALMDEQARLKSSLKELQTLSLEDPLLGVGNRRAMEVDLSFTEAEARRHDKTYALALLDIDFFKRYNDSYGHRAGDVALKAVAQTVKQNVRESDRVFRYGGEELLVLMPETDTCAAQQCIERVREAVQALALENEQTPLGVLTLSGGVCAAPAGNWQAMVEAADQALYAAKRGGRNQVCLAGEVSASGRLRFWRSQGCLRSLWVLSKVEVENDDCRECSFFRCPIVVEKPDLLRRIAHLETVHW